jgi:K+-transporting ATPase A subunit
LGNLSTPDSVQKLQTALHAKAKAEPGYRFYALYDKISRDDILAHAYAQCRSNKGAPGVDRQDFEAVEAYGVERWLGELAFALRQETYRPDPIRRVYIPKANGKLRPLGISTLRDRVCMTAAMLVLEPIFEADLPPEVYAYRPGRNAQQAVVEALGVDQSAGNLESKEIRFGQALSSTFATATTSTSTGAVNTMHDSLTPIGGLVPMFNLLAGCIWPGGVGAGLYGFLVVVVIAVFVAGLMVGCTPEYLGKKIETREMKLAMFAVLIYPLSVLGFSAASVLLKTALDSLNNAGPHGLSEIIYAFASANANNGSAFAGLNGNTPWFNTTLGIVMLLGRFAYVIPVLALAGSLAAKKKAPASAGTFPTTGPLFVGLLLGVIVILYLLQYFPALALGPVVEQFLMLNGKAF